MVLGRVRGVVAQEVVGHAHGGGEPRLLGHMPELIEAPSRVEAAGTKPKLIDEFVGRVNSGE